MWMSVAITANAHNASMLFAPHLQGFEQKAVQGAQRLIEASRPVVVTERHTGDVFNDTLVLQHGYKVAEIPEICGPNLSCRNRIWIPSEKWALAMEVIQRELDRKLQPENSPELP